MSPGQLGEKGRQAFKQAQGYFGDPAQDGAERGNQRRENHRRETQAEDDKRQGQGEEIRGNGVGRQCPEVVLDQRRHAQPSRRRDQDCQSNALTGAAQEAAGARRGLAALLQPLLERRLQWRHHRDNERHRHKRKLKAGG